MSVPLTLFIDQYANTLLAGLTPAAAGLISVAIFSPLIEEFSKAFPLFYRHGETQRSIFYLALLVGFGFGLVEFPTYVLILKVPPIDRVPGILFHPASTSITAYGIATKKTWYYYLIAVSLHFANNFLGETSALPVSSSIVIVTITILISWQLHSKTKEKIAE